MVFVLVLSVPAIEGKLQNAGSNKALHGKAPHSMDQTFNINNWGLGKADRKLLTEMKYKIDSLYGKFRKGKLNGNCQNFDGFINVEIRLY